MMRRMSEYLRYSPLWQIILSRAREFFRQPEAVFWVYGFPILLTVGLGIAFRNQPIHSTSVDIVEGADAQRVARALADQEKFETRVSTETAARVRLRTGKTALLVRPVASNPAKFEYVYDPTRPEGLLARNTVDDALQRALGRTDPATVSDVVYDEPGGRYIDFLVPGLLGLSLMGGGLWGVGFVTVDLRIRKLLKRFLATPMKKHDFLAGVMISRILFMIPEMALIVLFARLIFGVRTYGSLWSVAFLLLLGAFTFSGLGLLVACRAKTLETVSGLMNLVMLPMWLLSGVFFAPDRFPAAVQPLIYALPLTPLIHSLREVMLEGASLSAQGLEIAILSAWTACTFAVALRWFRWS